MSDKVMYGSHFVGAWTWVKEGPGFGPLFKAYSNALKVISSFNEKRAEIESSTLLTPEGKSDELRKFAAKHSMPALSKVAKVTLPAARRYIDAKRDAMQLKGPDKTDVAGALLRQEIRSFLRNLDDAKRTAALSAPDVDPDVAAAVMEAPAPLSGVTNNLRTKLIDKAQEALHPEEQAAIKHLGEAVETVERAMRAAEKEITRALRLTSREWAEWLQNSTAGDVEPPRLRRYGDEVKRIIEHEPGKFSARSATPEEIELGVFVDGNAA